MKNETNAVNRTDRETERNIRFNTGDFIFLRLHNLKTGKTFPANPAPMFPLFNFIIRKGEKK
jgi:hypothetical protein